MVIYFASAALLLGVAVASSLHISYSVSVFLFILVVALVIIAPITSIRRQVWLVALCICIATFGMGRVYSMPSLHSNELDNMVNQEVEFTGVIVNDLDIREYSTLITLEITEPKFNNKQSLVLVRAPTYTEGEYGDEIKVTGLLSVPESFNTDNGRIFNYPGYLAVSGIGYIVKNAKVEVIAHGKGNPFFSILFSIKNAYLHGISASLPEPAAALAGGITAGEKRSLGQDLLQDFRTAGIVHIVVLSGYNITIIAETLLRSLAFLPLRIGIFAGSFGIIGFALMTGAGASIVRASIMAILALIARALHRPYAITRALALAVVGMVLWNPFILMYDLGFQLSVLATVGLIFVSPVFEKKFTWVPSQFGVREVVGATLGTQFTVMPLLLYQMGTLSIAALPVNVLVLIVMPMAMLFSFVAAIVGLLIPSVAVIGGIPAYILLSYILAIVDISVSVPFAALSVPLFDGWLVMVAYVVMFLWLWRVYKNKAAGS